MGRRSLLTPEQWLEIERRHIVDGVSINALAIEFGINESSVRRKIKPDKAEAKSSTKELRDIAHDRVKADAESKRIADKIAELPYAKQRIVSELARKLTAITEHLCSAAEYGASTAHRLAGIANGKAMLIDDASPLDDSSLLELKGIAVLTRTANEASEIGVNLLKANKDISTEGDLPTPVSIIFGIKDARRHDNSA